MFDRNDRGEKDVHADRELTWLNYYRSAAVLIDSAGLICRANEAFAAITGVSGNELTGLNLSVILPEYTETSLPESAENSDRSHVRSFKVRLRTGRVCDGYSESVRSEGGTALTLVHLYETPFNADAEAPSFSYNGPDITIQPDAPAEQTHEDVNPELLILLDNKACILQVNSNPGIKVPVFNSLVEGNMLPDALPSISNLISEAFEAAVSSGNPVHFSHSSKIDGDQHHFEYRLMPLEENRMLVIIRDITSLKNTEDALVLSSERLNHMQQISGIGSWDASFNGQTRIMTWNFFELLDLDVSDRETITDDIYHLGLIHPEDLSHYKQTLDSAINRKEPSYSVEYRIVDKKKKIRHFYSEARLEYDGIGTLRRWAGTIQDITTRKKAESLKAAAFQISQLIHSRHNLPNLMEAIHRIIASLMQAPNLMIAMTDLETHEISFPYCSDPEGVPAAEAASKGLIRYVLKSGEPMLVSSSAIDLMISERIITESHHIPESWLGVPLKTHDKVLGVLVLQSFTPDITYGEDEKNMLTFVSEQIALSIQRIGIDEALLKAKDEAEESSRLKSSLLANMSHELRTPMTGILGFSEILQEELEEERLRVMASTIYKSANRLMSTLNSIMDLSAIESNIDSLKIKAVNVKSVFLPLLRNLHSTAGDKGLYLRTALPPAISVRADEKLLGQLLYHLLDNAIKFTIDGGISISAYLNDKNKSEAIIRVSDTGIGIAPEHHKLIFEEFRQVSEGLSRTFEGSGLGLSLCVKIARLLNARLWVDSVPEKGSDFYIALPYVFPEMVDAEPEQETDLTISTKRLSRGPVPEVLIVEDNEINRRLAALYLRELCNTEMAENGYVALEKIRKKNYDAIMMDINLGAGPNGMTIASQVRMLENYKDIPIIAVTGYTMQGDREKLLSNGCSHYLAKPYDKKTLLRLFSGILYKS